MRDVLALVFICWIVFEITSILGPLLPSQQTKSKPITPCAVVIPVYGVLATPRTRQSGAMLSVTSVVPPPVPVLARPVGGRAVGIRVDDRKPPRSRSRVVDGSVQEAALHRP